MFRRQFSATALVRLLAGGMPGVAAGTLPHGLDTPRLEHAVLTIVGGTIAVLAMASLWRLRHGGVPAPKPDRSCWLPRVALPIGVGFSSRLTPGS